ncbi:MAG TPA: phosphatase PAP2 family protein [Steroidobacteraceae bacterium]|nr:phosphatase PAP2 family protein [Steroidobacteraceae bacterium]
MSRAVFATVVLLAAVSAARAADRGYLAGHEVDFHTVLGPPPAEGSLWDQADGQLVQAYQSVDEARWRLAEKDAHEDDLYSRFAEAFGKPIDSRTSPVLVALLDRALRDVDATTEAAKKHFHRPRPFQRLQLQRVCEKPTAPKPEPHAMTGTSYPSGHSTYGWTVAMILARVAPDRAETLMGRAEEFEISRLVCGVHFPTDVEAGHSVAIAVVSHLDASKAFQADLARARQERSAH